MRRLVFFLCNTTVALASSEYYFDILPEIVHLPSPEPIDWCVSWANSSASLLHVEIKTEENPLQIATDEASYDLIDLSALFAMNEPNTTPFTPPEIPTHRDTFPWTKRLSLQHVQGTHEGVAYGTNYSTAAALFASKYHLGHTMPMVDARVHRFDNNTYAANLGLAGRYLPEPNSFCEILGFNLFGDWRQGLNANHNYYQIGVGIEVLSKRWDFRANAYYPFGMRKHHTNCAFEFDGGFFLKEHKCEAVSYGYNAEVGYYLLGIKSAGGEKPFLLYAAIGPYYLARKCHDDETLGGKVRLRPQYRDYLALDLSYSYDPVFRSVFQAEIIVTLPFYQIFSGEGREGPCGMSDRQVYQPIERFEVMPLGKRTCFHSNF